MVDKAIARSVDALKTQNVQLARQVYEDDHQINERRWAGEEQALLGVVDEDVGGLVDQCEHQPLHDFLVVDLARKKNHRGSLAEFQHASGYTLGTLSAEHAYPVLRDRSGARSIMQQRTEEPPKKAPRRAPWQSVATPDVIPDANPEDTRSFVREAMVDNEARQLTSRESAYVLKQYGIEVVPFRDVRTMHEASAAARELGFPVVVKSTEPAWVGRVDREGARLDLSDATAVITAFNELQALTGSSELQV